MKLSILIPVYNERKFLLILLSRVILAALPKGLTKEIILVDDFSTDGTREIIIQLQVNIKENLLSYIERQHKDSISSETYEQLISSCEFKYLFQRKNQGKGAAIRRAIDESTGDYVIIQDADLEYDPRDYQRLLVPLLENEADVVYGSRFRGEYTKVLYYWHSLGNKFLTTLSNIFTDINLTDMETCYKIFKGSVIRQLYLTTNRFGFEPEVTARVAKAKLRIFEVPISYHGRTYEEGKKITWKDGFAALWFIIKFNLFSHRAYRDIGHNTLLGMEKLTILNKEIFQLIKPHIPKTGAVCEIGSGIGNISKYFVGYHSNQFYLTDVSENYLTLLREKFHDHPNFIIGQWDIQKENPFHTKFDLIASSNLLEHIENDKRALANMNQALNGKGKLFLLVPAYQWLYCNLDKNLDHYRRYTKKTLTQVLNECGFKVIHAQSFNFLAFWGWLISGKIFKKQFLGGKKMSLYGKLASLFFALEKKLKLPIGASVIVVAEKISD